MGKKKSNRNSKINNNIDENSDSKPPIEEIDLVKISEPFLEINENSIETQSLEEINRNSSDDESIPDLQKVLETNINLDENVEEPVISTSAEPVISTSAEPVISTSAEPVISTSEEPVISTSAEPVISTSAEPVISTSAEPVISTSAEPVISTSAEPVISTSAEPVISTSAETIEHSIVIDNLEETMIVLVSDDDQNNLEIEKTKLDENHSFDVSTNLVEYSSENDSQTTNEDNVSVLNDEMRVIPLNSDEINTENINVKVSLEENSQKEEMMDKKCSKLRCIIL